MIHRRNTLTGLFGTALAATAARPLLAKPPPATSAFKSGSNYRLSLPDCGDLLGVSLTIDVTEDIVCKPTNAANGFNFQLNSYSNQANSAWQQYIVGLLGTNLHCKINNFSSSSPTAPLTPIVQKQFPLLSLPNLTLPAGYRITVTLLNDGRHNITGAEFTIKGGGTAAQKRVMLANIGLKPGEMAPIVAFEEVLVGPAGGHTAVLKSGGGTFAYSAAKPLVAASSLPDCVAHRNGTAEKANSVYGALPANPGANFTQTFSIS